MTNNNDLNSLLSELQEIEKSERYLSIDYKSYRPFDSQINDIIENWTQNESLSNEEEKFLDLYSKLQLSFVEYCLFNSDTTENVQTMISNLGRRLFQTAQIDKLVDAVTHIREQQSNNNNDVTEDDIILVYIMRLIDARSLAYRLCFKNVSLAAKKLNDELYECLTARQAKYCLRDITSPNETKQKTSLQSILNNHHQFFVGCCTFAVALYEDNKEILKYDDCNNKYIYLLAKYVRVILTKANFDKNESIIYCVRGILAFLTNCIPTEHWLNIMNEALGNENDDNAQEKNPFNLDLFSLIVNKLLASNTLQKKAKEFDSNNETLLLDTVLVFLNKWSDTQEDLNDNHDKENKNDNNNSSPFDKPNQLLRCLRSHNQFERTVQIIIPYVDAEYDRLRLMALSILSNIMDCQDFENLKNRKSNMAKDFVKLIFGFINQAEKQHNHKYKGISFDRLIRYLLRFLRQDFVKEETLPYVSQIVNYAKQHNLYALKILLRISTDPDKKKDLLKNVDLEQFLQTDSKFIYDTKSKMYKIIEDIRRNLAPPEPSKPSPPDNNNNKYQAFISYRHLDKDQCDSFVRTLKEADLFTNIWIDKNNMKDDMVDTITKAIRESKVVFVLLSHAYCASDICRREWTFAWQKQIKVYPIFLQEDFKRDSYDWVDFYIGQDYYYKIYKEDELKRLIDNLRTDDYHKQPQSTQKTTNDSNKLQASSLSTTETTQPGKKENWEKKSIAEWTSEDIQAWCRKNNLGKWCEPLANYHGRALLELNRLLATDEHIQHIANGYKITVLDVVLFKCELDELVSDIMIKQEPRKKKHSKKRRSSKASVE